ncbi:MAG TPA: non-heme iron oxygenase ferredoxin subunit [Burkholderiaceae bacterium]|nr:non-heme iron oxygenase ferredoxin subunit [Burkholderiaceae bacterium]
MADPRWTPAARADDVREGDVIAARAGERAIAIYRVDGEFFATEDRCTHGEARLSEGFVIDHCIECPLHQGQFDIRTGAALCEPVTEPIRVYPVRVADGVVEVDLSADGTR